MQKGKNKASKTPYSDAVDFVKTKRFELRNVGITGKNSFDWRVAGLYLQDKKTKFRMKYSPLEYVWLLLIKELREYGFLTQPILKIKDFLIAPIDVQKLMDAIETTNQTVEDSFSQTGTEDLKGIEPHLVDSLFCSLLVSTLMNEDDYILKISKEGECMIESLSEQQQSEPHTLWKNAYLTVSLSGLVRLFLEKENITDYNTAHNQLSITDTFDQLLEHTKLDTTIQQTIKGVWEGGNISEMMYKTADGKTINIRIEQEPQIS